jgi:hypothetical protein
MAAEITHAYSCADTHIIKEICMPHVSVHYKIYLSAGHHRQPRNLSSELEPNPSSEVDVTDPGNIVPLYIPQLPYLSNGVPELAQLLFWSVTDGTNGQTHPAGPLTQSVGASPLTITAWYFPVGGGNGNGSTFIIDDAFSAVKGDFIDDTFVTVTTDPSLTSDANVVGIVPTAKAETLQASAAVASTTEPFSKWLSFGAGIPGGNTINVPASASGIAIAVYERSGTVLNVPSRQYEIGGFLIGGVAVDGGGAIVINGKPHPVDPWGPLVVSLAQASLIVVGSSGASRSIVSEGRHLAAKSALESIKQAIPRIEKQLQGKE